MTTISHHQLYELLCNSRGGQWVTITAVTRPQMISPWNNAFIKVAVIKIKLKCNYERCVNLQRERENKNPNFQTGPLPWGEWDIDFPNSPFILLDNKLYLRVLVHRVIERHFYTSTGKVVPNSQILPFLRRRSDGRRRQKLKQPVRVRTYAFDSIRRISVGGNRFRLRVA